eukprot:GHRQ01014511.1.p1 GENE.GHRQ01014511.1~~GHRQ01014511.1.p1  ORF type:complete len:318 (+),score=180.58 GHRQ01014511.1:325-1278(+)
MPRLRVLDVTGFEQLSAGGWRQLAAAWPRLAILRLGGSAAASSEALKALHHILPGILPQQPAAAAAAAAAGKAAGHSAVGSAPAVGTSLGSTAAATDWPTTITAAVGAGVVAAAEDDAGLGSWEEAFASDPDQEDEDCNNTGAASQHCITAYQQEDSCCASSARSSRHVQQHQQPPAAVDCRLKELRVLVWPDVPPEALQLVQQRCPRVAVNPSLLPDAVSGLLPPPEVDPGLALDAAAMALVGPQALQDMREEGCSSSSQPDAPVMTVADRFRAAYVEQAARLRDKERRLWKAQQRRQLRSSHALRTVNAWLDEPA